MREKSKAKPKKKKSVVREWIDAIIFAGIAAIIIRTFILQTFKIPTGSMESTFLAGDFLIANKFVFYFKEPEQFEPIIFKYPGDPYHPGRDRYAKIIRPIYWDKKNFFFKYYKRRDFIKRIIGVPGDTLEIIDKNVYINGKYIKENYVQHVDFRVKPKNEGRLYNQNGKFLGSRDNFGPIVIPEGKYFVMGDNRDNSHDSRYWGFLDRKFINGIPMILYWSWDNHHHIRWRRLLKII